MQRRNWGLILVLVAYVALAVGFSLVTPPFEAPDEIHHYAFIRDLVRDRALPVQHVGDRPSQRQQPPLYYLIGSAASLWIGEPDDSPYSVARSNPYWGYGYGEVGRDNKNLYLHGAWDSFPYQGVALGIHLVRLLSVLMGAGTLLAAYAVGREIFPRRPILALGGMAFVAFNPQFLFISGAVNNDNLLALLVTAILLLLVRTVKQGITLRRAGLVGVLSGLAVLTKLTGLYVLPVVAVAFALATWRRSAGLRQNPDDAHEGLDYASNRSLAPRGHRARDEWRRFVEAGAIIAGLVLVIAGPWFARNWLLYGEPTSLKLTLQTWHARPEGISWSTALFELPNAETSFWARFGYGNVPVPNWIYSLLGALSRIAALSGVGWLYVQVAGRWRNSRRGLVTLVLILTALCVLLVRYDWVLPSPLDRQALYVPVAVLILLKIRLGARKRETAAAPDDGHAPYLFIVLFLMAVAYFAAMFSYMTMSTTAANGRYMFPGLAAISLLVFLGIAWLLPQGLETAWARAATAGMAALACLTLVQYQAPAYSLPPIMLPESAASALPHDLNVDYAGKVRLLGCAVGPARLRPGDTADVTLYWQPLTDVKDDYVVFVQLFGRDRTRVGQRDSFPGLGNYPTSEWHAGEVIVDSYRVPVDLDAAAPTELTVDAGLYEQGSLQRLPATQGGQSLGGATVARGRLLPRRKARYEWQQSVDFKLGAISLQGYSADAESAKPGGKLQLKLYWQATEPVLKDYTVFIHVLDDSGKVWAQQDAQPVAGNYPTGAWDAGETVEDVHEITLPADLPAGRYRVGLGMYLLETMERLPATDGRGVRLPDDRIMLWDGDIR